MEQQNKPPSRFHNFHAFQPWKKGILDVKKKRKLLTEHLSLPAPKLQNCWGSSSCSEGNLKFGRNPKGENSNIVNTVQKKPELIDVNEIPKEEDPLENERNSIKNQKDKLQPAYDDEDDLREFEIHGNDGTKQNIFNCSEGLLLPRRNKLKFVLPSRGWRVNPDLQKLGTGRHGNNSNSAAGPSQTRESKDDFVLSSGRWKVNSEAQVQIINPNIDREFEQYFSVFMP